MIRYILFIIIGSISFSQKVNKDGFVFIFPKEGYEGTPLGFEVKLSEERTGEYEYVWDFGHSRQYKEFTSYGKNHTFRFGDKKSKSIGPKFLFT